MQMEIARGDYGRVYQFTIKEKINGVSTGVNLAGLTVKLKMWREGNTGVLLIDDACVVTDAPNGVCTFTPADGDFDISGDFKGEVELTSGGLKISVRSIDITVTESP